jgi:hypothetical protein
MGVKVIVVVVVARGGFFVVGLREASVAGSGGSLSRHGCYAYVLDYGIAGDTERCRVDLNGGCWLMILTANKLFTISMT